MAVEYYGWIALLSTRGDWADSDFDEGYSKVEALLSRFSQKDGHDLALSARHGLLPRTVWFKGRDVEDFTAVLDLASEVAKVFNAAYGQLQVFDYGNDASRCWAPDDVRTYVVQRQQVFERQ